MIVTAPARELEDWCTENPDHVLKSLIGAAWPADANATQPTVEERLTQLFANMDKVDYFRQTGQFCKQRYADHPEPCRLIEAVRANLPVRARAADARRAVVPPRGRAGRRWRAVQPQAHVRQRRGRARGRRRGGAVVPPRCRTGPHRRADQSRNHVQPPARACPGTT